jgi:hypothetical protein
MNLHGIKLKIRCDKRELNNRRCTIKRAQILKRRILTNQHMLIKKRALKGGGKRKNDSNKAKRK